MKQKLKWFGHVPRSSGLAKTIIQGTVKGKGEDVDRRRDVKTLFNSGQDWTLSAQLRQLETEQG